MDFVLAGRQPIAPLQTLAGALGSTQKTSEAEEVLFSYQSEPDSVPLDAPAPEDTFLKRFRTNGR